MAMMALPAELGCGSAPRRHRVSSHCPLGMDPQISLDDAPWATQGERAVFDVAASPRHSVGWIVNQTRDRDRSIASIRHDDDTGTPHDDGIGGDHGHRRGRQAMSDVGWK